MRWIKENINFADFMKKAKTNTGLKILIDTNKVNFIVFKQVKQDAKDKKE